jgi:solute carrier family 45 protein 1/2/4
VGGFYALDFSINAVQAAARSLIVDYLSCAEQPRGHSYASAMISIGNVVGYSVGAVNLVKWLPFLGNTQMKVLTSIATIAMLLGCFITCFFIDEKPLCYKVTSKRPSLFRIVQCLVDPSMVPYRLLPVLITQFFSWYAWFPFMFYRYSLVVGVFVLISSTEYVREMWLAETPGGDPNEAVRYGSFVLCLFSLISIFTSMALPYVVSEFRITSLPKVWSASQLLFAMLMLSIGETFSRVLSLFSLLGICMAVSVWIPVLFLLYFFQ